MDTQKISSPSPSMWQKLGDFMTNNGTVTMNEVVDDIVDHTPLGLFVSVGSGVFAFGDLCGRAAGSLFNAIYPGRGQTVAKETNDMNGLSP